MTNIYNIVFNYVTSYVIGCGNNMDFYDMAGKMALGSRLRRLADYFTQEAQLAYEFYDVGIEAKHFPVFYILMHKEQSTISDIAKDIGHSHPSVSKSVKEMAKLGLVETGKSSRDSRINSVTLSDKGKSLIHRLNEQCVDVHQAAENLINEAESDLWQAIEQIEHLLAQQRFFERVKEQRKQRELSSVSIIDYQDQYQPEYAALNKAWIEQHFELEQADINALEHPKRYILEQGGAIFLAKYQGKIVGSCAMLKMDEISMELAKMAVMEQAKGKGIGYLLGLKALEHAKEKGFKRVYLESNAVLVPAINLYKKLGFKSISGHCSPYERCNVQMELYL